jgi:lysophospholipase L1-like esterase
VTRLWTVLLALVALAGCTSPTNSDPPTISKTKFLAFGDSITFGVCGPQNNGPSVCPSYVMRLEELLSARYTSQTFTMTTRAVGGESTALGRIRLPGELDTYKPEVLLLMEGTNDVVAPSLDINGAVGALEDMIVTALDRGVIVFVATIPPLGTNGPFSYAVPRVPQMNNAIRLAAARRGVVLVDVFAALNTDVQRYFPVDDVHPTAEGMRVIGQTFYTYVRHALDSTLLGNVSLQSVPSSLFNPPAGPGLITNRPAK